MTDANAPTSELILYQTEDGRTRIECRLEGETVWLTQALMAEQFQITPQNITQHLREVYAEGELDEAATCKSFLQVRTEGRRQVSRSIVNLYIEYAELQAPERRPMTMRDWIDKLDEFLKASGRNVLDHAGTISAEAEAEFERYRAREDAKPRASDAAFENVAKQLKEAPVRRKPRKGKS